MLVDRFGRRRAIVVMAAVWSLVTLGAALAADYGQLLAARVLVGVGEAAYASVGLAVVFTVFPAHRRASLAGAFSAGGAFGAVVGVALGGALAARFGWRWSVAAGRRQRGDERAASPPMAGHARWGPGSTHRSGTTAVRTGVSSG
ncbi:MFS transporter [Geodermatophilus sabuli]|uniref:Major Facilitator Superfamily protein n=1 Tax=Geodermatophilus sabuli TaxID=1564158 RepID=A0A285EGW8_9ACTN|nr:MFS transporter [Geodermatophilus sabuli]MBB3086027.1 MFS family permease [Geodermatophilus sabuli]SNX98368.1 Major Facilitator Superfamily protein [Geodermatophilus sabuli]